MHMATATRRWTVEEVRALPDDTSRYEVIDGELFVTPGPTWRHGEAAEALFIRLRAHCATHMIGHAKIAPQDVTWGDRTMVEPDIFVVPVVGGRRPRTWEEAGRLLLAVEVLSPSSARADRIVKRRLYQRVGVPEYWIVDVDARAIERWLPNDERPEILTERLEWQPDPDRQPFVLDLAAYFAEVFGEGEAGA